MSDSCFQQLSWNEFRVKDIISAPLRDFGSFSLTNLIEFKESGVPFIKSEAVKHGYIDKSKLAYITEPVHKLLYKSIVRKDDILYTKIGALGRVAIYDGSLGVCNSNAATVKINLDKSRVDPVYFTYLLMSEPTFRELEKNIVSTPPRINLGEIGALRMMFPPIKQQQKIAKILSTVDKLIEDTQSLIDKYTDIKQGMMADLFTRGIDLSKGPDGTPASNPNYGQLRPCFEGAPELYKETELGWVPREWEVVSLGEIAEKVTSGSRDWAAYYADEGDLFVRISNLTREHINFRWDSVKYVDIGGGSEGERTRLEEDDILISITADLGIIGVVPKSFGRAFINQHTALVRIVKGEANSRFIGHFLQSYAGQKQFEKFNDSGAKAGLNLPTVSSLKCLLPPVLEQEKVSKKIDIIDQLIADYKVEKKKYLDKKNGLMQDLLTGKVKVN